MKINHATSRVLLIAIVLAGGGAIALSMIRADTSSTQSSRCFGALIPAYRGPDALAELARSGRQRVVIVNPANGPGPVAHPGYQRAIQFQRRAGAAVLGYVHTGYATRDRAAVLADIRRYRSWYGIGGVFLDEVTDTNAHLPYYRSITAPLRASGETVALNPGTVPARGYFDVADIVVTFEGPARDYPVAVRAMPDWERSLPREQVAHLIYGASAEQALQAAGLRAAGYFYATSGTLPDPWSTVPSYLRDLEDRVATCS